MKRKTPWRAKARLAGLRSIASRISMSIRDDSAGKRRQ